MVTKTVSRVGYITVGPSNQGKTHYCLRELIPELNQQHGPEHVLYTSGDFERQEMFDTAEVHLRPAEVWQAVYAKVRAGTHKRAIIIDGTHLQPQYRAASREALSQAGITNVIALVFSSQTLATCQQRSSERMEHRLLGSEIERHFRAFVPVGSDEGFAEVVKL